MSTDQEKAAIIAKAEATAEKMAQRVREAYVRSVTVNVDAYGTQHPDEHTVGGPAEYMPDEDDFFAWLEGYDWSEE